MNAKKKEALEELLTESKNTLNELQLSEYDIEIIENFILSVMKYNTGSLTEASLLVNSIANSIIYKNNINTSTTINHIVMSNLALVVLHVNPSKECIVFITSSLLDMSTDMNIPLSRVKSLFRVVYNVVSLQEGLGISSSLGY